MNFYPAFQTQRRVPPPAASVLPRNEVDFNDDPDLTIYDRPVQWRTDVDDRYRTTHEALRAPSTLNSSVPTTPLNRTEGVGLSAPRAGQPPRQNSQTGFASPNPSSMILNTALHHGGTSAHSSGPTYPTITSGHPSGPTRHPSVPSGYPNVASGHPSEPIRYPSVPSGYPKVPSAYPSGSSGYTSGPSAYPNIPPAYHSGPSGYPNGPTANPSVISGHPSGSSGYTSGSSGFTSGPSGFTSGPSGFTSGSSGFTSGPSGFPTRPSGHPSGPSGYSSVTSGYPSGLTGLSSGTSEHSNAPSLYHPSGFPTVRPREVVPTAPLASVNLGAPTYDEPSFDFSMPPSRSMWDP